MLKSDRSPHGGAVATRRPRPQQPQLYIDIDCGIVIRSTIMEFDLKWVRMARYELILRLDGALWVRIMLKPLLTPKTAIEGSRIQEESKNIDFFH